MQLKKGAWIVGLLSAVSSLPAFAATALPKPDAALLADVIANAKLQIKSLSRPVAIYHWTHRSDVKIPIQGEVASNDPRFNSYLERRYRSFYRPDPRNQSVVGTGLYAAIDPSSTRSYGGRNWVLYQMVMKKGTRFLNLGEMPFSSELASRLKAFGCDVFDLSDVFSEDSTPACQALRVALGDSKELNIQAFRYTYLSARLQGCGNRPRAAFLIWGGRDMAQVTAFTAELPANDPDRDAKILLQQIYLKDPSTGVGNHPSTKDESPYPTLKNASPKVKAEDWMRVRIMGCDNYPEDSLAVG